MKQSNIKLLVLVLIINILPSVLYAQKLGQSDAGYKDIYVMKLAQKQQLYQGMAIGRAIQILENKYSVVVLYNSTLLFNKKVRYEKALPNNLMIALEDIVKGYDVHVQKVNAHSYAIYNQSSFYFPKLSMNKDFKVHGTVKDASDGEALPGVDVVVKGTTIGTSTNQNGDYSLNIPKSTDTLVYSYIGYISKTVAVQGRSTINVSLKQHSIQGKELVVVGFGSQKKKDVTGSISTISQKYIKNKPVTNVSDLIIGNAAGVYAAPNSGQPGQAAMIRIRGFGTINNNNPLYVVDGQIINNLNDINPSDIQSIEILKDASATAIYGSRGANGVILITTKEGKRGVTSASFNGYVGVEKSYRSIQMQNSKQYYNFIKQAYQNSGQSLSPKFTAQYNKGYNTNWWNAVNQTGLTQNYDINVNSGSKKSESYFSVGYENQNGSIITTKYKRVTLKLNTKYFINSRLTAGVHLGAEKDDRRDTGSLINFSEILDADPFTPVINPNVSKSDPNYQYDKYAPPEWSFNPNPVQILRNNDGRTTDLNLYGNVYGRLNIVKGLNYYVQYSFEDGNNNYSLFQPKFQDKFDTLNLANQVDKYRQQTQLTDNTSAYRNYSIQQRLHYTKSMKNQNFDVMVAMKYQYNLTENINAFKENAPGNGIAFRVLDAATMGPQVSGGKAITSILSYLGRINYSLMNRYLATVNFRADGSSIFSQGHKWGYFPSFSLGWRISSEPFFKNLGISNVVNNLKIRFGWGQTGNQNINRDAPLTLIGTSPTDIWYFGNGFSQGYVPTYQGNPNIKWETSQQTNFGLNGNLFDGRLSLSADYYIKNTENMLLQVPLPSISGYPNNPYSNAGSIRNTGVSFSSTYNNVVGGLSYSFGVNLSTYKTTVTYLGNGGIPIYGSVSKTVVGGPIGRFYGYKVLGIFQNQQQINSYVGPNGNLIQPNAKPGDFKFADLNHDGVINASDRTFIGNPNPKLIYGFNVILNYKHFDFSAFFQGTLGNDIYNGGRSTFVSPGFQNALAAAYVDAWRPGKTNATYPRITLNDSNNNYRVSNWFVENGSFLRLQNIQLGYNFKIHRSNIVKSCRIYINGNNIFTITKYTGLDPSFGTNGNPLNLGYDSLRYPSPRSFNLGVSFKF